MAADVSVIDKYATKGKPTKMEQAWDRLDADQREILETACGLHGPEFRRPRDAIARWLTDVTGVNINRGNVSHWMNARG